MLNKILLKEPDNPDRQIKILSISPSQYPIYDTKEEVSTNVENKNYVFVFHDKLENKQKGFSPLFTSGRHEKIDLYYLSQK